MAVMDMDAQPPELGLSVGGPSVIAVLNAAAKNGKPIDRFVCVG